MLNKRFTLSIIAGLVLAASCTPADKKTSGQTTANTETTATQTGTPPSAANGAVQLPAAALIDLNGKAADLKSFAGKKVFVNLWATWCPPCRAEMPSIEKLYEKVDKDKATFIMLSLDDNLETVKKYVDDKGIKLPVYYPNGNLPELFNVRGIPATFIFNEKGELIEQKEGAENYDTDAYKQLLGS